MSQPPVQEKIVEDSATAILSTLDLKDWEDCEIKSQFLSQIGVTADDYAVLVNESLNIDLLQENDYFKGYFTEYAKTKKQTIRAFIKEREFDKLKYFALVYKQTTLIITAPADNAKQKEFLGYDWSNRKGAEGIVINKFGGMMFDAEDRYAEDTLAYLIKLSFFEGKETLAGKESYYAYYELKDLIDFSRIEFDKAIKTTITKKMALSSKYPMVSLLSIPTLTIKKGSALTKAETINGNIKVVAGGKDYAYLHNEANRTKDIITISASGANAGYVHFWDEPIWASDCTTIQGANSTETLYIYYILTYLQDQLYDLQKGAGQPHVYPTDIGKILVPKVDESIQKQIVGECLKVDEEYNSTRMSIEDYRKKIEALFNELDLISRGGGNP